MASKAKLKKSDSFKYKRVQLYKNDRLGAGTFGVVCKARCDQLECAAKLLHPRYFDITELDASSSVVLRKFHQECDLLEQLRSPYITQYLGRWMDPETRLPVLLMELMDENLTAFLKRHQGQLPFNIQVDICSDVAQALAYLHSNKVIHRDLSSNNVLISAGRRAKVSDFGMSKLAPENESTKIYTLLGSCPYMPPEASSPHYTEKLDSFSLGVLTLQIITGKFPSPDPMVIIPEGTKIPQLVTELERRKEDVNLVPPTNFLLRVAISCMQDSKDDRPSAQELCTRLDELKAEEDYKQCAGEMCVYSSFEEQAVEAVKCNGKLLKQVDGRFTSTKKWKAYFFKVTDCNVSFFSLNDTKHTVPRAQIKIEDIVNIDFPAVKGATFPMAIYFKGKVSARNSPWVLNADSELERRTWMEAFKSYMPSQAASNYGPLHYEDEPALCATEETTPTEPIGNSETMEGQYETIPDSSETIYEAMYDNPDESVPPPPPIATHLYTPLMPHTKLPDTTYVDISDISYRILLTEEDDEYNPRPKWAKALTLTDPKRQHDEAISVMQMEALYTPRSTVTDLVSINHGEFGEVFKAILNKGTPTERVVAVKTIKKTMEADQENFLREMATMSSLIHPNLVRLHGIVKDEYDLSPWIVLEYLPRGDLKTFLTENEQPHHKLIKYMNDVAMGMHYISGKGLVHRDLAARNVLVGDGEVCKVSDFGLLRELPKGDAIYYSQSTFLWPIRWMAPESLSDRVFSQATDVWSFGVLQWEMFNPTELPYKAFKFNQQVAMKIAEGYRMPTPRGCPPVVARMVKACWHKVPEKRPSFLVISTLLRKELP